MYAYCINNPIKYKDSSGCKIELADEKQREAYEQAIEYLKKSPTGRKLIETLEKSDVVIKVYIGTNHDNVCVKDKNEIEIWWSPTSATVLDDGNIMCPAITLAHEMGHAEQHISNRHVELSKTEGKTDKDVLEKYEWTISKELSLPIRNDYNGWITKIKVSTPTAQGNIWTAIATGLKMLKNLFK